MLKVPNQLTSVNEKGDDLGWGCLNEMSPFKGLHLPKGRDLRHGRAYGRDSEWLLGAESGLWVTASQRAGTSIL